MIGVRWVVVIVALAVLATGCSDRDDRQAQSDEAAPAEPSTESTTTAPRVSSTASTSMPSTSTPSSEPGPGACTGADEVRRTVEQYGDGSGPDPDLTTLEVITPVLPDGCGPTPVMVWVHGGGWRTGDRRNGLDDKIDLFASMGWTLVSVNYRLTPQVRYPVHNDDVAAAIDWVLDHSTELGVDPGRVSLMGHSAGAGIVAAVSVDPEHLERSGREPSQLRCVVLLDTEGYDVERMAGEGTQIYLYAFGEDPTTWREASPIHQVDPSVGTARSLVVTRGGARRQEGAAAYVRALQEAGVEATLVDASPLSHAEVNAAVGAEGDTVVTPAVRDLLVDC
jgi:acetyl esterase/lipase